MLLQLFGHLVLTFDKHAVAMKLPDFEVETADGVRKIDGFAEHNPYTVLGSDANSVAIRVKLPNGAGEEILLYHFDSDDLMWLYVADSSLLSGVHIREYFKRVK